MFHSLKKCKLFLQCGITCRFTKISPIWLFWSFFGPLFLALFGPKTAKKANQSFSVFKTSHAISKMVHHLLLCNNFANFAFLAIFWPFSWPIFGSSLVFKKPKIQIKPCKSLRLCMLCPKSCPVSPVCNNLANLAVLAVLGPNWAVFGPFLAQKQPKIKISLFQPSRLCMPFPKRCHTCIFEKKSNFFIFRLFWGFF